MEFAEHIATPKVDGVILHSPFHEPVDGTLCVTGHHLILSSRKEDVQELWVTYFRPILLNEIIYRLKILVITSMHRRY